MFESAPTLGSVNVNMDSGVFLVDSWTQSFGRQTCTAQVRYLEIKKSKSWSKDYFPDIRSTIRTPVYYAPPPPPWRYGHYRMFSLTWPASMQIYWNKRKCLHEKGVQLPEDWFGTQTWPPFHCFGTPIWPPWLHGLHVKALYYGDRKPTRHFKHTDNTDTPLLQSPR